MANQNRLNVIRELIKKHPDAPAKTLARRVYAANAESWPTLEACYLAVRRALGVAGPKNRRKSADKSMFRQPRPAGWSGVIPESVQQLNDWRAVQIIGSHRALILSDIHIPFHDEQALEVALEYGAKRKPTLIILNGDIGDHYATSKFVTNPKHRDFPAEVRSTRYFLSGLRKRFKTVRIVYKLGNHDERYSLYMRMKCAELLGLPEFEFQSVYGLDEQRIELVDQKRPIRLGKLNVIHGHEYSFAISNPVNPARGFYMRAKAHVLGGHLHRSSQHSEKNVEEKVVSAWSAGCLCELHPEYAPLNAWNHGFAFVESGKDGSFAVDNLRIFDGRTW